MLSEQQLREQPPQTEHQVVADGQVIYSGEDWQQAFLDAGMNPTYGTIEHRVNGEPGATFGPPVYKPQ